MANSYPKCEHIKREKLVLEVTEDLAKAIGQDYRTIPIFEKGLFEYSCKKHYSLQSNEYIKCRWSEFKKNIESRVHVPFQFIDIRDYHFYDCRNRLIPSESIHTKKSFVRKLKPGPGTDVLGQLPIPDEFIMKRGGKVSKDKNEKKKNEKKKCGKAKLEVKK